MYLLCDRVSNKSQRQFAQAPSQSFRSFIGSRVSVFELAFTKAYRRTWSLFFINSINDGPTREIVTRRFKGLLIFFRPRNII